MKKSLLTLLIVQFAALMLFGQTAVWNPAANPSPDGLWSTAANWTTAAVPAGIKVVFNVPDAATATIDSDVGSITQLVQGDGNDGSKIIIADGGVLTTTSGWSGIGWNDTAALAIETGGMMNFGSHMWTGHNANAMATIDISGTVNVADNIGLGRAGGKTFMTIHSGGLLSVRYWDAASIGDGSVLDIQGGTLTILDGNTAVANDFVTAGKLIGYSGGGTINVDVVDGKTVITANTDETAPTVLSTSPAEGANDVPGAATISIEFSEPMDMASVEAAITTDIANPVYSWNVNTLSIKGDDMTALQAYYVTVGTGAMDKNNHALAADFTLNFSIIDPNAPPTVVSSTPADAATDVSEAADVVVVFSKAMNTADVEAKITTPEMTNVTFAWTDGDKTLTISSDNLAWETVYTVTIPKDAAAADATLLAADFVFSFTVKSQPLTTTVWNPAVDGSSDGLWTTPANWTINEMIDGNYKVVFNVPNVPACVLDDEVNINKIVMGDAADGDTLIIADGGNLTTRSDEWSAIGFNNTATLVVEEGGTLTIGNHMWIGLEAGADANVHLNGGTINNVNGMFGLSFQGNGNKDTLFLNSGVLSLAQFHETQSIGADCQIIIDEGMMKIKGNKVSIINDYYIANNKIVAATDQGGLFVAHDGVKDTTFIYVDKTAPSVVTVVPTDAATDIAVDAEITIEFTEPMHRANTEGAITVTPALTGMYFSWLGTTLTVAGDPMTNETAYTVTVGTAATDVSGNTLAADYSFGFTTVAIPTYTVIFNVSDANGALEAADVTFQSTTVATDASGAAVFTDVEAVTDAAYSVTKTDYEVVNGTVSVIDEDVVVPVTLTSTIGTKLSITSDDISIYPNPASDILTIEVSNNIEVLKIINTLGKVVYLNNHIQSEIHRIDVSDFAQGIYFVRTQNAQGNSTISKIVVK